MPDVLSTMISLSNRSGKAFGPQNAGASLSLTSTAFLNWPRSGHVTNRHRTVLLQNVERLIGYKRNFWGDVTFAVLTVVTGGLVWLADIPQLKVCTLKECPLHEAQYVLAEVQEQQFSCVCNGIYSCLIQLSVLQLINKRQVFSKVHQIQVFSSWVLADSHKLLTVLCRQLVSS